MTSSGIDPEYPGLSLRVSRLEAAPAPGAGFTLRRFVYVGHTITANFYANPQAMTVDVSFAVTSSTTQTGFVILASDARAGGVTDVLAVVLLKLDGVVVGDVSTPAAAWDPDLEGWGTFKFLIKGSYGCGVSFSWPVTFTPGAHTLQVVAACGSANMNWGLCSGGDQSLVSFLGYSGLTIVGSGAASGSVTEL